MQLKSEKMLWIKGFWLFCTRKANIDQWFQITITNLCWSQYQKSGSVILLEDMSIWDLGLVRNMNRFYLIIKDRNVEILRTMYLQALRMIIGQKGFNDFIRILSYNISRHSTPYHHSQGMWACLIYQPQKLSSFITGVQLAPGGRTGPTFRPSGWDRPCCHFISDLKI